MIEDKEMGIKVAEDSDEKFWIEQKEQCVKANEAEARNAKVRQKLIELCDKELSKK